MIVGGYETTRHNRILGEILLDVIRGNIGLGVLRSFLVAQVARGLPIKGAEKLARLPDDALLAEVCQAIRAASWLSNFHGEAKARFLAQTEGQPPGTEGEDSKYHGAFASGFWIGGASLRPSEEGR